jgi:iron complex transport system ATP-binding protein
MAIIQVDNISFSYPGVEVLKKLRFDVEEGRFLAVAGPNGSGKTSLLNLLCGNLKASEGSIVIDSAPVHSYETGAMARKVAMVRQQFIPVFGFTAAEAVMMGRTPHMGRRAFDSAADRNAVSAALEATDTLRLADRTLSNLSAGERQRVFIARALAQETPILLLDEPTSFLDLKHQVQIYDLLKAAQKQEGKTILIVTHDINLAAQYCDSVLLMAGKGSYYTSSSPGQLLAEGLLEKVFDVRGFTGKVGREGFFLPLGRLARDSGLLTDGL